MNSAAMKVESWGTSGDAYATHCQREWEIERRYAENRPVWFLHHHGQAAIYSLWHISLASIDIAVSAEPSNKFIEESISL